LYHEKKHNKTYNQTFDTSTCDDPCSNFMHNLNIADIFYNFLTQPVWVYLHSHMIQIKKQNKQLA